MKTTKRLLFLVSNAGNRGTDSYLSGVPVDMNKYATFFQSPQGGNWKKEEILKFNSKRTKLTIESLKDKLSKGYDYCIFIYCGHGSLNTHNESCVYLDKDSTDLTKIQDIVNAFDKERVLFIFDCCRGTWNDASSSTRHRAAFCAPPSLSRKDITKCLKMYNQAFMQIPAGTKKVAYSTSKEQYADEDSNGGLFSQSLITNVRTKLRGGTAGEIINFEDVFNEAKKEVETETASEQIPELNPDNSLIHIPFAIVY